MPLVFSFMITNFRIPLILRFQRKAFHLKDDLGNKFENDVGCTYTADTITQTR